MNSVTKAGLASGVCLTLIGWMNAAHAGVQQLFITGNQTTCAAVFSALASQHGIVLGAVKTEIPVDPLADGTYASITLSGQQVDVLNTAADDTSFDWVETTPSGLEGLDLVAVKAGNGRTVWLYTPDATSGTGIGDLNTTQKITQALFCADDVETIVSGGELCSLDSSLLGDLCAAAGNTSVVEIYTPGTSATQICACPGVTFNVCSAAPIGSDPGGTDPAICDPDNESCCLVSPFCPADIPGVSDDPTTREDCPTLAITGVPVGTSTITGSGSFCSVSTTTSGGGGAGSFQFCFP